MKLQVLIVVFLFQFNTFASEIGPLKLKCISFSKMIFGETLTTKIFGETNVLYQGFTLPKIPLTGDLKPTDLAVYQDKRNDVQLTDLKLKQELDLAFIKEIVFVVFERGPLDHEWEQLFNNLDQGGTREGVYRSLVLSDEYYRLEEKPRYAGELSQNFAKFILAKYADLDINFKKDFNYFSLKRTTTEKLLDVLDLLPTSDVTTWYAILSVDLARNHQVVFKNSLRQSTFVTDHYSWASKVPYQLLKSELIIKIHSVFNKLSRE
jgi:hypothetical protein